MDSALLSQTAVAYLSGLTYRADAQPQVCHIPLGGIYWPDEIPDFLEFMRLGDAPRKEILALFGIRFRIWESETLTEDDQRYWDTARSQVPDCPIFQRARLSHDDYKKHQDVQQALEKEFEAFFADADRVTITDEGHGLQSFSATYDLTRNEKPTSAKRSWWSRWFRKN